MKIAVFGTGIVGNAIATKLVALGHDVKMGSRTVDNAKAAAWVVRHWTARQREALWTSCLTATTTDPMPPVRDPEAERLGLLPAPTDDTLPRWILPHLAPLGMSSHPSNDHVLLQ